MPKSALPCVEFGASVFHVPPACLCSWALHVNLGLTLVVSTALWLFFLMFLSIRQELPCSSLPTLFGLLAHAERHSAGILMAHAIDFSALLLTVQVVFVHYIDQVNQVFADSERNSVILFENVVLPEPGLETNFQDP